MTSRLRTTSSQPWNIVVFVNVEIHNFENVENNVVNFSVGNVQLTYSFSTLSFTMLTTVETTWKRQDTRSLKIKLYLWALKYFWASNKNHFKIEFYLLSHFNRNIEKNICKAARIFETSKCWTTITICKPFHFAKCHLDFT